VHCARNVSPALACTTMGRIDEPAPLTKEVAKEAIPSPPGAAGELPLS
jgi:hypothetical protein